MGILTLPKKQIWTSQPQGAVGINRSNEFGRKVDVYHLPPSSSLSPDKVGMAGLFKKQTSFFNIGKSNAVLARPFTVVIVACSAQANDSYYANLSIGSGNGFRLDAYTTGGGAYAAWTAQGVANGQTYVDGDGLFDTRKTVIVSDWTASGQTSWRKRDGQETVTWSDTFSYLTPGDNTVLIGGNFYAVAILFGNVGELGARRLIDNPWQIFKRPDSRIFVPVSAGGSSTLLSIFNGGHAHTADQLSLSTSSAMSIFDGAHAHAADAITLNTTVGLTTNEASHSHVADQLDITSSAFLSVSEATHAQIADQLSLSSDAFLMTNYASHAHAADSLALSVASLLSIVEAFHANSAEQLTLLTDGTIGVNEASHSHTVDQAALSTDSLLAITEALHTHVADTLTLDTSNSTALTLHDAAHEHAAESLGLTLDTWLSVIEASHAHSADAPTLSTETALSIAEALHAMYADVIILAFPSTGGTGATAEEIAAAVWAHVSRTLTQDIAAQVVAALKADPDTLTVPKFIGLS